MIVRRGNIKVGIFVIVAIVLLVTGVVVLGAGAIFRRSIPAETYLNESVQGLDVGSPVKIQGVQIGSVKEITFVANEYPEALKDGIDPQVRRLIMVKLALNPSSFGSFSGEVEDTVKALIANGLRIRLASQGLTGTAYLECEFLSSGRFPPMTLAWEPRSLYIPSAPSTISRLTSSAEEVFNNLKQTDVAKLINDATLLIGELRGTVADVRSLVDPNTTGGMRGDVQETLKEIRTLTQDSSKDIRQILADFRDSSARLAAITREVQDGLAGGTLKRTTQNVEGMSKDLRAVAASLPDTLESLNRTLKRLDSMVVSGQRDLAPTLDNLSSISENLKILTENAKRYPSQVLFGNPPPRNPGSGN